MNPDTLLERAQHESNPLIDGDKAIFLWQGESAPYLIGDFNDWGRGPAGAAVLEPAGRGLWWHCLPLPENAYIEYIFTHDPDDESERLFDPLNTRLVANGFGKKNNYFRMPDAVATPYADFRGGTLQGTITRHSIYHPELLIGDRRDVWLFHPPVTDPVPLLVILDGRDYLRRANITHIVTNLMNERLIAPLALAMIDNARENRFVEYYTSEATLDVLIELVLPLAHQHIKLLDLDEHPGAYGVLGAQLAGEMALYAGLRRPDIFGKVGMQSGAFALGENALLRLLIERFPVAPVNIWQNIGCYDPYLEINRNLHWLLVRQGYPVTYRETPTGHNVTAWRDLMPQMLATLYGAHVPVATA
jgi:enterochelin esterase family protein